MNPSERSTDGSQEKSGPALRSIPPLRLLLRGKIAPVLAFLLPLVTYGLGLRYLGSGDTIPAELLPISLLTEGNLDFNEFVDGRLPYWFRAQGKHVVSYYPILPGLLNVPAYAVAHWTGGDLYELRFRLSLITAMLAASLSVLFVYLTLARLLEFRSRALGFALVYAFATEVWSVASHGLFQHGPALLFLSTGLYLIVRSRPGGIALSGLLLALGVLTRPTNIGIALPLAVYVALRHRARLPAFLGFAAIPLVLHGLYAWKYWGTPFSPAQPVAPGNFSGDPLQGLAGLLVSPSRGLFVFSPIFLFSIPAAVAAFRRPADERRVLLRCLAVGVLLVLGIYSRWVLWWGGHSFGYRIILELALPLVVLIASDWPRIRNTRARRVLFGAMLTLSVLVQFLGAFLYPSRFNHDIDQDPARLWDPRNSELVLSVEKLLRRYGWNVALGSDMGFESSPVLKGPSPHWWKPENDDASMPRSLDTPAQGAVIRGRLTVLGWAKPAPTDAGEVRVSVDPGNIQVKPDRFSRPDVISIFPDLGDGSQAGFAARLEPRSSRLERYTVLVEIRDRRGRVAKLGPVEFFWGPQKPVP